MNKFKDSWDAYLNTQKNVPVDLIGSISDTFIQDFLNIHRVKDGDKYFQNIDLPMYTDISGQLIKLTANINVGGKLKNDGTPDNSETFPFIIDFNPTSTLEKKYLKYKFKEGIDFNSKDSAPDNFPDIILKNDLISAQLIYPKQDQPGEYHKVNFDLQLLLKCKVDFVKENNRTSLKFIPTYVEVGIGESLDQELQNETRDLLVAIINYLIKDQAPKLIREFELPVFEIEKHSFIPNFITIKDSTLSIYLNRNNNEIKAIENKVSNYQETYLDIIDSELNSDNIIESLFGNEIFEKFQKAGTDDEKAKILEESKLKPIQEIIPNACSFLDLLRDKNKLTSPGKNEISNQNIALAVVEDFLDTLLKDTLPGRKEKSTKELKALDLIKGRIRTWLKIFDSDINIEDNGTLSGSAKVDVGAMLEYKLKEFYKCSTGWSNWKGIGLRVYGRPELSAKVKESNRGVGIYLDVDLMGLNLQTGLGRLIDALINVLFKLFLAIINGLLDILSSVLSFIIFPVKFELDQQSTTINFSNFVQWRYTRPSSELRPNEERYLSFLVTGKAK